MKSTVRCIVVYQKNILFLQKSKDANMPYAYELPGGKVDSIEIDDQILKLAAQREVFEETNIYLNLEELIYIPDDKITTFNLRGKTVQRKIYYFAVNLYQEPDVQVNRTLNANGEPEDKHLSFRWINEPELEDFLQIEMIIPSSIININIVKEKLKNLD